MNIYQVNHLCYSISLVSGPHLTYLYLSCSGKDTWGSYGLTLIDALDTLYVMGEMVEFERACKVVIATLTFDLDKNVSVFETNIRIVGGLVAAHLIADEHFASGRSLSVTYSLLTPIVCAPISP